MDTFIILYIDAYTFDYCISNTVFPHSGISAFSEKEEEEEEEEEEEDLSSSSTTLKVPTTGSCTQTQKQLVWS